MIWCTEVGRLGRRGKRCVDQRAKLEKLMRFFASFLFLALSAHQAISQTVHKSSPSNQDLTPEQNQAIARLANLEKNFGSKMNSSGVELSLRESSRSQVTDRTLVKYGIYAKGLPMDTTYTLVQIQLTGQPIQQLTGITLDGQGRAICAGRKDTCRGNGSNDPIDLILFAGKSEPKRFGLISDDPAHLKGFFEVIPFPNTAIDKNCRLESIIGTPKGEVTFIRGTGFEPNEELTTDGESYGEKNHVIVKADADGSYFAVTLPNILGQKSGETTWEVKGKSCDVKLTFPWGTYHLE